MSFIPSSQERSAPLTPRLPRFRSAATCPYPRRLRRPQLCVRVAVGVHGPAYDSAYPAAYDSTSYTTHRHHHHRHHHHPLPPCRHGITNPVTGGVLCLPSGRCPTIWPAGAAQGASFNETAWNAMGHYGAVEMRALNNVNWGPAARPGVGMDALTSWGCVEIAGAETTEEGRGMQDGCRFAPAFRYFA